MLGHELPPLLSPYHARATAIISPYPFHPNDRELLLKFYVFSNFILILPVQVNGQGCTTTRPFREQDREGRYAKDNSEAIGFLCLFSFKTLVSVGLMSLICQIARQVCDNSCPTTYSSMPL